MKVPVLSMEGKELRSVELPEQFGEELSQDLISRAFKAIRANERQPYGADPRAGERQSGKLKRRRRDYKTSYGIGMSRVPRKTMSRRGRRFNWIGAFAPGTVGGRRAHPPKAEKIWEEKINKKERRKAIRSAISATMMKEVVAKRGHSVPKNYPFIIETGFEKLDKTKNVREILAKLGFEGELSRAGKRSIRSGKGKIRGRKYKRSTGPLIVVSEKCRLLRSARNLPGIAVVPVARLSVKALAPGNAPGRLSIFTEASIERLAKEKLFMK